MKENYFVKTLSITAAFIAVLVFIMIYVSNCRYSSKWQRNFISIVRYEKQEWIEADTTGIVTGKNFRPWMARDLVKRKILIGKSREEVVEMLGQSEDQRFTDQTNQSMSLKKSILGILISVAVENFVVTFNSGNKAEKAEI